MRTWNTRERTKTGTQYMTPGATMNQVRKVRETQ